MNVIRSLVVLVMAVAVASCGTLGNDRISGEVVDTVQSLKTGALIGGLTSAVGATPPGAIGVGALAMLETKDQRREVRLARERSDRLEKQLAAAHKREIERLDRQNVQLVEGYRSKDRYLTSLAKTNLQERGMSVKRPCVDWWDRVFGDCEPTQ